MCGDFLAVRMRLLAFPALLVEPFEWAGAISGECWYNVNRALETFGGSIAYGWALAGSGPISLGKPAAPPLYDRWVNHALWRDRNGRLWEVTPRRDAFDPSIEAWSPTTFVSHPEATFEVIKGVGWAGPSCYVAARPEGQETADCLCEAERASPKLRDDWLDRALASIERGGFVPRKWKIEMSGARIKNLWLIAE